jgi:uncharacterized protein Yka (UPF0111/DUF47 family)
MTKTEIVERLGEAAVLLPEQLAEALAANDRAKLRLTLLQEAAGHAQDPSGRPNGFGSELRRAGMSAFDGLAAGARALDRERFNAPGLGALLAGLGDDLDIMAAPVSLAAHRDCEGLRRRREALGSGAGAVDDAIAFAEVGRMTSARRDGPDTIHRLIMDLHRAINELAAETAVEDIDGAKVHHLADEDRERVRAFMRGLRRTAPLAFGHPGLGTTAAHAGETLVIQNDIGETDAHVLVVHVEGLTLTVTYTDVHRRRARFFMGLFGKDMAWSPLAEQAAEGLGEGEPFYLVTGELRAADEAGLSEALGFLGSRIVFLIDWNKARKTLQTFVERDVAVDLLAWAAAHELGHRAFLVLGGADLVLDAVRRTSEGRIPYGIRLDAALGEGETRSFLRRVLKETAEGLRAGRSARLIRDEIQAQLAACYESVESAVLALVVRHLGLSRTLASLLTDALARQSAETARLPDRAKRMEAKADRMTVEAREACARLSRPHSARALVDAAEDAMDALEDCAFLLALAPNLGDPAPLTRLAQIVTDAASDMTRATQAAARLPEGVEGDAEAALRALDAVARAERDGDAAERSAVGSLMAFPAVDARPLVLGLEVARKLERASDHFAHAALALRQRVLEELAA